MSKINLLPKDALESKPLGRFLEWALSYGRYIIITVELVVFLVFFSRFIYDRKLADLNDKIEQKQAIVASAQQFEKEFRYVQDVISYIETLDTDRQKYLEILATLERITPIQVSYDSLSFSENSISLQGSALNNESFAQLLVQLKNVETFSRVSLDSFAKEEDIDDEITFVMSIDIASKPEIIEETIFEEQL